MSLQMILGNSGSGKTRLLYEKVIQESRNHPEEAFLVLVPEQFTLQTQKELVNLHPDHGILNIDVLSFQRLAWRIFEETGTSTKTVLEETGKNLLLRKVAQEKQESLKVLGGNMKKQGFISQVKSMISELTQYDISPEELGELAGAQKNRPSLYYKLEDVKILYEGFQERLHRGYIAAEELLEVLGDNVQKSELLRGCTIALDGFTGFTPIQQKLLLELFKLAKKVYVTVTIDVREELFRPGPMHELFYLSRKTICSLNALAEQARCPVDDPIFAGSEKRGSKKGAPALHFLEQHLYRSGKYGRGAYPGIPEEISLHTAANPAKEAEFTARTIWRLIREEGWHYGEIAVITGDLEAYANPVRRVFGQYGIPVFIDETRKVLLNPALEFVKAALDVAKQNYTWESVVRLLRTGMAGIPMENVDLVENYLRAAGIRGKSRWEQPWERPTKTIGEAETARCEEIRQKLSAVLVPFTTAMKGRKKTARELCETLYGFLVECRIQEQLAGREKAFEAAGKPERAREYRQIYGIIMELLDKIVELLGEEILSLEEFGQILEAGFEEAKAGMIPPEPDRVLVGDIERTRLKNIRALFFMGLNDGLVPMGQAGGGFLTDQERTVLIDAGASLAPGIRENSYIQRFYLYLHLTKPSDRLFLSYAKAGADGTPMRPSSVIARIQKLFPKLAVQDEDRFSELAKRIAGPVSGLPYLTASLPRLLDGSAGDEEKELYRWYLRQEGYQEQVKNLVRAATESRQEAGLGAQVAKALYGQNLENSVSRLERYAACAYAHFLMYGLELAPREEYVFQPVDMGNVFHGVLELFARKLEQTAYTWFNVPQEVQERLTRECVREVTEEYGGRILHSSARSEYAIQRMERIMLRTVWAVCEQVRKGGFVPSNFEVPFSTAKLEAVNLELSGEETMRLRGRIDRIDVCQEENQVYVKVIDYKSGSTEFDLVAMYYGLQLQLVVYLNAALELEQRIYPEKEIVPAGIFYYHVKDPMLEVNIRADLAQVEEKILKELRPDGLVSADPDVIRKLDRGIVKDSAVVPVSFNKDGSLSKTSKAATKEQFGVMSGYVRRQLTKLGQEILEGHTEASPYERKGRTACDYCSYREVCCFDPKIPGNRYRRLREYKAEDIFRKMEEEERHGSEMDTGAESSH
ncbi:MAG: helicase-exonuclease AddAB subunit AddB [Eubacteriales bacterium]|nr:helicase-exonuclease AddAB subunit AddB [Eubacteriales bacterium]